MTMATVAVQLRMILVRKRSNLAGAKSLPVRARCNLARICPSSSSVPGHFRGATFYRVTLQKSKITSQNRFLIPHSSCASVHRGERIYCGIIGADL
mmetsp:Transcript_23262/g.35269  ORF Transcript_23262/g.35269 Transcript_23262/m.35269 type:complete len:96 (+) Transcript_23262:1379-1666(+)